MRAIATGATQVEYTPIGHTTNLASRLQSIARTGSIAASEATRKFCEGYFTLKPLGPTRVKGVSESVNVYEVTGLGPLRTKTAALSGTGVVEVRGAAGRDGFAQASRGAGQGGAWADRRRDGRGGGRQVSPAFRIQGHQRGGLDGARSLLGLARQSVVLPAGDRPTAKLLQDRVAGRRADPPRENRRPNRDSRSHPEDAIPYLYSLLGIAEQPDPLAQMDAQTRKRGTLDAIKRIILRESLNQPLMVIFEDLHWIDEATQAFLNLLADSIGTAKILLLVNYRPEYSHQWNSKTYYTQLRLDPLGKESADEMLSALLGEGKDPVPLKRLIKSAPRAIPSSWKRRCWCCSTKGRLSATAR